MKRTIKYFKLFIATVVVAMMTACSDVDIKGYYISGDYVKSEAEVVLDGNGKSFTYKVITNGAWSFTNVPSWVTVTPMSGNGDTDVIISPKDNPSATQERTGQMTLRTSNQERVISITQKTAHEFFESDIKTLTFQPDGGTERFSIRSNTNWSLNLTGSFFSVTPTKGSENATFTVVCEINNDETQRFGSIDIVGRDSILRIPVAQLGITRTLTLSPENITVAPIESKVTITLNGDAPWTASSNVEWATIKKLSGTGSDVVDVIIDENATTAERIATITFETSKKKIACQITQRAGSAPRFTSPQPTITNVGKYSATVSASYTSSFEVTEYGVCYSETNSKPTIEDAHINRVGSAKEGSFSIDLEGLKSLTTYYVTVYARNKVGVTYSTYTAFKTTGGIPDENDVPKPNL